MFPSLWWVNPVFDVLFIFLLAASRRSAAGGADLLRPYLRHACNSFYVYYRILHPVARNIKL
jgi:hypothetical protein